MTRKPFAYETIDDYEAELQEILIEAANFRLQEIAADMAEARAEVEADELFFA